MKIIKDAWSTRIGKLTIFGVTAFIFMCCCFLFSVASSDSNQTTPEVALNPTDAQNTAVAFAWTSVASTNIANAPTNTFTPPPPTDTPRPTVTFTPAPEPITLTGSGDSIVDIEKWDSVALFKATYTGGSNFAITNYGAGNEYIDLLVNTIGSYSGSQLIDIYDNDHTVRFEIKASGPWEIQILPISRLRRADIPGVVQGIGDDVVALEGNATPDILNADASQASGNFAVWALSLDLGFDLVFNEIAPYTGTALTSDSTFLLQIKAEGPWSIEVVTR